MIGKRVPVILGCSSPAPREVIELAEYSAKVGGDFIQVLMPLRPWGGQPTIAELMDSTPKWRRRAHCRSLAITTRPGADPPQDAFVKISEIDNIRYFKESSQGHHKDLAVDRANRSAGRGHYFTTMQPLLVTLMLGGRARRCRRQARDRRADRQSVSRRRSRYSALLGALLCLFPGKWGAYGLPPVMKSAMKHFGVESGIPADPTRQLVRGS